MNQFETEFVDAVDQLELPEIDLVTAVLERIDQTEPGADRRLSVAAAVAVLLLAVAGILVFTPAGQAVADWFGIGSTGVEIIDEDPNSDDATSTPGSASTAAPDAGAGRPSLDSSSLGVPVVDSTADPMPSLGPPDSVFDDPRRGRSFLWRSGTEVAILLSVRSTDSPLAIKSVVGTEGVEFMSIDSGRSNDSTDSLPALWIRDPHDLRYPLEAADLDLAETLTSGPVLIWLDGEVEYRLEGIADQSAATELAREAMVGIEEGTKLLGPG